MDVEELVEMAKAQDSRDGKHPGRTRVLTVVEHEVTGETELVFNRDGGRSFSADTLEGCIDEVEALCDEQTS